MNKKSEKPFNWQSYKRLLRYALPYKSRLIIGIICGMIFGGGTTAMIGFAEKAFKGMDSSADITIKNLLIITLLVPLFAVIRGVGHFTGKFCVEWVGMKVVMDVRNQMFHHILNLPMKYFSSGRIGEMISRISGDTNAVKDMVTNVVGDLIMQPFVLISCIGFLLWKDWRLSLLIIIVFPMCFIPVAKLAKKIKKASKANLETAADLLSHLQESLYGAKIVKAFQAEHREYGQFVSYNDKMFKRIIKVVRANAITAPLMEIYSSFAIVGVVFYGWKTEMPIESMLAYGMAVVAMYKPAKQLSGIHLRMQGAAPAIERIFDILDIDDAETSDQGTTVPVTAPAEIRFNDVTFAYGDQPVLKNVSLQIKQGQCVAFVGHTGSGKSTLVNLIPRFYDVSQGSIAFDGTDLRKFTLSGLRSMIAMVTQETVLFNRSVADNIAYGVPKATREEIVNAAKRANAHDFIVAMENGYDTPIGERGSRLSGGMAQRVAIARALLKNPPILILDEATSALDNETEKLVQGALNELMKNRTVFVIAHRLSTITHADNIVVMDNGCVIEQGTHQELLEKSGKYKLLYEMQFQSNNKLS